MKFNIGLFSLLFWTCGQLSAQSDSLLYSVFSQVEVVGFDSYRTLMQTPGGVAKISHRDLTMFQTDQILFGMNTIPGVRMEERSTGSYRIAIRGSSLRSPFGIRNVKVYWNNIPFTDATGSTALNLLDPVNMVELDLIKGPSGSLYGAGNGGVLQIKSYETQDTATFVKMGSSFGSFGYQKYQMEWNQAMKQGVISSKIAHQKSDGYRQQSALDRTTLALNGRFQPSALRKIEFNLLASDLAYEIPGGLTAEQFEADPSQARPGNPFVLGSEDAKAGIDQQYILTSVQQNYTWNQHWQNSTVLYSDFSKFKNPFNLDYKRELRTGFGLRTTQNYYGHLAQKPVKLSLGTEFQQSWTSARNFENDYGQPGTLNFDDEISAYHWTVYTGAEWEWSEEVLLTVGLSRNQLNYGIDRLTDRILDTAYTVNKGFDPVYVPRIGWSYHQQDWAVHGSLSYGFSPPTIEEVRTNEGSINEDLEAEQGLNIELGFRKNLLNQRLFFESNIFHFLLDQTIVQQQSERGTVLFNNSGATRQSGLEVRSNYKMLTAHPGILSDVNLGMSYTFHYFKFKSYRKFVNGEWQDYSENALPGVAPHSLLLYGEAGFRKGWYVNSAIHFNDGIYLDDNNSIEAEPYQDLKLKFGKQWTLRDRSLIDLYFGINNVLNQRFSLGNDLNAFGGRYFQPAPPIHIYGGFTVKI